MTLSCVPNARDPGEPDASACGLSALRIGIAFDVDKRLGALAHVDFGTVPLGPRDRCLRFVRDVAVGDARLASGVSRLLSSPAGLSPGITLRSFSSLPPSSSTRLSWRTVHTADRPAATGPGVFLISGRVRSCSRPVRVTLLAGGGRARAGSDPTALVQDPPGESADVRASAAA